MGKPSKHSLVQRILEEERYAPNTYPDLKNKSYKELSDILKTLQAQEISIDDDHVELEEEVVEAKPEEERNMEPGDEGWTDYVLDHLRDDEKSDGHPKTDGLRRLVEKFIGRITDINSKLIQPPCPATNMIAAVTAKVTVVPLARDGEWLDEFYSLTFSGTADASLDNCKKPFDKHLSAVAETRAEGRAFRKLLRLQSVVTAEELGKIEDSLEKINEQQIQFIDRFCSPNKLNLNVENLVKSVDKECKSIRALSYDNALDVTVKINDFQQDLSSIPDDIKNYDSSWKDSFK